jgi:hypothetical protein
MAALAAHVPQAEVTDVSGDDFRYWREIEARWTGERDLIVIEQKIRVGPETIQSLEQCQEPWCVFAYTIPDGTGEREVRLTASLGCAKFSAAAQRTVTAAEVARVFGGKGYWWHLDVPIAACLRDAGFSPHVHGDVPHLHGGQE